MRMNECDICGERSGRLYECWGSGGSHCIKLGYMFICRDCLSVQKAVGPVSPVDDLLEDWEK